MTARTFPKNNEGDCKDSSPTSRLVCPTQRRVGRDSTANLRRARLNGRSNRLLAVLNIAMADTAVTIWIAKRFYGGLPTEVTWRPATAVPLAETDGNPATTPDVNWLPLVNTPSHPEYPAGHPSLNVAAATVLLSHFSDRQTFTLTTTGRPDRTFTSNARARADGDNARVWGGMHYPGTVAISDAVGEAIALRESEFDACLARVNQRPPRPFLSSYSRSPPSSAQPRTPATRSPALDDETEGESKSLRVVANRPYVGERLRHTEALPSQHRGWVQAITTDQRATKTPL